MHAGQVEFAVLNPKLLEQLQVLDSSNWPAALTRCWPTLWHPRHEQQTGWSCQQ